MLPDSDAPGVAAPPATLTSQAYERLRADIMRAAFAPRQKLRTRQLCEHYQVGLAPLREALTRLSREGLVVQTERRGFALPPFGLEHLEELTRTRCWVNELALRASIRYADPQWEKNLVLTHHRLTRLDRYLNHDDAVAFNPEWEAAHHDFHRDLIAGCRSAALVEFCTQLFDTSIYYRQYSRVSVERRQLRSDEHEQIFRAAINRDADEAVRLLCAHFTETADLVAQRMQAEG